MITVQEFKKLEEEFPLLGDLMLSFEVMHGTAAMHKECIDHWHIVDREGPADPEEFNQCIKLLKDNGLIDINDYQIVTITDQGFEFLTELNPR